MSRGRRYCKVSPRLHTGRVGRSIRGEDVKSLRAQSLAAYLASCPHGNAIGIFFLPLGYIMADRGWGEDGACDALSTLRDAGLIRYDDETEWVWLIEHFRHEHGPDPAAPKKKSDGSMPKADSRIALIHRLLDEASESGFRQGFLDHHGPSYPQLLGSYDAPCDAPSTPRTRARVRVQEQEQEQEVSPTGTRGVAGRPLNAQAQKIQRLEAVFKRHDEKPPSPKILALWLKTLGSEEKMIIFLEDMANRGKLGVMEYCGKVVRDWKPPRRRGRGSSANPSGFLPDSALPDRTGEEGF